MIVKDNRKANEIEAQGGIHPSSAYAVLIDARGKLDIDGHKFTNLCWMCWFDAEQFLALLEVSTLDLREEMLCSDCREREIFDDNTWMETGNERFRT